MDIMAFDLGHNNQRTEVCFLDTKTGDLSFGGFSTTPKSLVSFLEKHKPDRVVMEICPIVHWVFDLVCSMVEDVQVASTSDEAWRWKYTKKKTDKVDALRLAELSALNRLSLVHIPSRSVRQWRTLIRYRKNCVDRRTAIKNSIRTILARESLGFKKGGRSWTSACLLGLKAMAAPLEEVSQEELWRGELWCELQAYEDAVRNVKQIECKLDELARDHPHVQLLMEEKGIGPRSAELLVATIDDPLRFKNKKQVGSYFGMVPRQYQSGQMNRQGRIHKRGDSLVRSMMVEISWMGLRYNPWLREVYEKALKSSPARKKVAIVAAARRWTVKCWAKMRDYERQQHLAAN